MENDLKEYFTDLELDNVSKELQFIKENPDLYKTYNDIEELKEDLLKED